jgi:negative regulator of sigma-B (phosphoserine phosphatase)
VHVEAHVCGRPRIGEAVSGDAAAVADTEGATWVMLVDGLGHGPEAEKAARIAVEELEHFDDEVSVESALSRLNERLRGTRGACAALARFDDEGVTMAGVGNVGVRSLDGPPLPYVPVQGVLGGGSLRTPRTLRVSLAPRTRLLLYTDGIRRRTPFAALASLDGEALCRALLEHHSHAHDDATLVHVTYLG